MFDPGPLLETLEALVDESGEDELEDLGHELLPRLVDGGGAREERFTGYWRDVGTVDSYWEGHQDLLGEQPAITLDDPDWPVLTHGPAPRGAAQIVRGATIEDSLVASGARVAGTVQRSVIGRGAVVEAGAVVKASVVLPGAVVRAGATVTRAVLDDGVEICGDASVGEEGGDVALVGMRASVTGSVPAGGRHPEVEKD